MKRLTISSTEYTPAIDLDPETMSMRFEGVSRPENVGLFYQQVIDWVDEIPSEIEKQGSFDLQVSFKLEYCNSATQKYFLVFLEKLVDIREKGLKLSITWQYDEGDDKMLEDGEDISDAIGVDFNFEAF